MADPNDDLVVEDVVRLRLSGKTWGQIAARLATDYDPAPVDDAIGRVKVRIAHGRAKLFGLDPTTK